MEIPQEEAVTLEMEVLVPGRVWRRGCCFGAQLPCAGRGPGSVLRKFCGRGAQRGVGDSRKG